MPKGIIGFYEIPLTRPTKFPPAFRPESINLQHARRPERFGRKVISILTASIYSTDPRYSEPVVAGRPDTVAEAMAVEDLCWQNL